MCLGRSIRWSGFGAAWDRRHPSRPQDTKRRTKSAAFCRVWAVFEARILWGLISGPSSLRKRGWPFPPVGIRHPKTAHILKKLRNPNATWYRPRTTSGNPAFLARILCMEHMCMTYGLLARRSGIRRGSFGAASRTTRGAQIPVFVLVNGLPQGQQFTSTGTLSSPSHLAGLLPDSGLPFCTCEL